MKQNHDREMRKGAIAAAIVASNAVFQEQTKHLDNIEKAIEIQVPIYKPTKPQWVKWGV